MAFPSAKTTFSAVINGTNKLVASLWNLIHTDVEAIETLLVSAGLGSTQANTDSFKNLLSLYIKGCDVEYKGVEDLYVRAGEMVVQDSGGNMRFRKNAADLTVTWANIDAGGEAASTTYYVYAVADAAGTAFTIKISTNATTPSGGTFYRKIGSFYNGVGGDIDIGLMTNLACGYDLSMLKDVAGMTEATGDIIYRDANGKWNRLAKGTENQLLTQGASIPSWVTPTAATLSTSGSYSGNATAGRAIAHGLGRVPKLVISSSSNESSSQDMYWISGFGATVKGMAGITDSAVSAPDATNFYCCDRFGNDNGVTYYWVAF